MMPTPMTMSPLQTAVKSGKFALFTVYNVRDKIIKVMLSKLRLETFFENIADDMYTLLYEESDLVQIRIRQQNKFIALLLRKIPTYTKYNITQIQTVKCNNTYFP